MDNDGLDEAFEHMMEDLCVSFYKGDVSALLYAVHQCGVFGRPPARWMVDACRKARRRYIAAEVRTIDEALGGGGRPKGWSQHSERRISQHAHAIMSGCKGADGRFSIMAAKGVAATIREPFGWVKATYYRIEKQRKAQSNNDRAGREPSKSPIPPAHVVHAKVAQRLSEGAPPSEAIRVTAEEFKTSEAIVLQTHQAWEDAMKLSAVKRSEKNKKS